VVEFTDTPIGADFSAQTPLRETLASTVPSLNAAIRAAGVVTDGDAIKMKDYGAEISNSSSRFDTGFGFWGVLRPNFGDFREPTAIINDIEVPVPGSGVGSAIVKAWEEELGRAGVRKFAAANIKAVNKDGSLNLKAVRFWEKQGYQPWGRVSDEGVPYAMVKTIEDQVVT